MTSRFKDRLANATFAPPNCDGSFEPDFAAYLKESGRDPPDAWCWRSRPRRRALSCARPRCAAVRGAFVRTVHAQGGRDASFYLPTFLLYYAGGFPARPLVTHVHMQALPANRHFMDTLGLKPVIMIRAIPDMLASYADMLDAGSAFAGQLAQYPPAAELRRADRRGQGRFPDRHGRALVCELFRHLDGICRRSAGARAGAGL